ncbi:MAG: hypothetical protein AB1428_10565 [Bacteroidota bacterium]
MMSAVRSSLVALVVLPCAAFSQQFSHPVSASRDDAFLVLPRARPFPDTVRVLAAMVQFAQDSDVRTTGDGRFATSAGPDSAQIDAPPRDRRYFEDHLQFLENYYRRASKGKVVLQWAVVDSVYTLPAVMGSYSPAKGGSNAPVALLARDTWRTVDSSGRVPDFSRYDCFVLFHAGVGRDIDLVSLLGYDPSPLDIPSLFIGPQAFTGLLGGGISVNGGSFSITNTIVMPETETRSIPGVTGSVVLELGINGLLCASFGNFLGLPDLFDTKTGRSGIGRFGLMDGQAIFSFAGTFPPEPSAWEKYWLGWIQPLTAPPGATVWTLPAVSLADSIVRIPVSDGEYFLIENRNRDSGQNGQRVTMMVRGVRREQTFARDTTGFNAFDISALAGNVTDVEDFDWSLPGGIGSDGTFFDGGVLIWHIDESVIRRSIASNGVNADPARRGVDLEEADGSQDIGQQYEQFSAGSGSEEGTALDFWFKGNGSPVNKNEFSAASFPNSNTSLGALSHVAVSGFGDRGPRMSFTVSRGDDAASPLPPYPRYLGQSIAERGLLIAELGLSTGLEILAATTGVMDSVYSISPNASLLLLPSDSTGFLPPFRRNGVGALADSYPKSSFVGPAVADLNADGVRDIVTVENPTGPYGPPMLRAFSARDLNADSLADNLLTTPIIAGAVTGMTVADSLIAIGGTNGKAFFVRFNGAVADSTVASTAGPIAGVSRWTGTNSFLVAEPASLRLTVRNPDGRAARPDIVLQVQDGITGSAATGEFAKAGSASSPYTAFTTARGALYLVDSALVPLPGFPVSAGGGGTPTPPVLGDIDGDGVRDIVFFTGNVMHAYNIAGVSLDRFPITVQGADTLLSPLLGDVDGDGRVDIVGVSANGLAVAYRPDGRPAAGFPLTVGTGRGQSAAILASQGVILLVTGSADGSLSVWKTGTYPSASGAMESRWYPWPQAGRDERRSGRDLAPVMGAPLTSEFFPRDRAYNWPNPVYSTTTHFRYFVKENADVHIRIFDLAGDQVAELTGHGVGGMDNEISWDLAGIQSGIYFARLEATSAGKSGSAIIKVAVVR